MSSEIMKIYQKYTQNVDNIIGDEIFQTTCVSKYKYTSNCYKFILKTVAAVSVS